MNEYCHRELKGMTLYERCENDNGMWLVRTSEIIKSDK